MINTSNNLITVLSVNNLTNVKREEITDYLSIFTKDNELVGISFLGSPLNHSDIKECHYSKIDGPGIYYDSVLNRLYYFKTRESYITIPVTSELTVYYNTDLIKTNNNRFVGLCLNMS